MKNFKMLLVSAMATLVLAACGTTNEEEPETTEPDTEETTETETDDSAETETEEEDLVLTEDELSEYDGTDGNPSYVAIEGVIYDVSDSDAWQEGEHNGVTAGNVLSDEILESPHGDQVLEDLPEVGTLEE